MDKTSPSTSVFTDSLRSSLATATLPSSGLPSLPYTKERQKQMPLSRSCVAFHAYLISIHHLDLLCTTSYVATQQGQGVEGENN